MDRSLASFLFQGETLYTNVLTEQERQATISKEEPKVKVEEADVQSPPLTVSAPVSPAVTPIKEPVKAAPPKVIQPTVLKMQTLHLVVVNGISAEEKEFLVKVLMALNMSLAKVDLLDISVSGTQDFKEIIYNNSVKSILFFGDAGGAFAPKLGLTDYQVKELKNILFLTSASLTEVSLNQNNEKRQLWEALKALYAA